MKDSNTHIITRAPLDYVDEFVVPLHDQLQLLQKKDLKDAPKHVIDAVKAESTKPSISSSSVNAVITITDGNLPEHKGPDPVQVQRCPPPSAELTTHQPQVRNVPIPPDGTAC